MTRRHRLAALAIALPVLSGCASNDDILARYRLEQKLWRAQFYQRRINISVVRASQKDTRLALAAFDAVLADQPLSSAESSGWRPEVVADIHAIHTSARVALANLYFLSERYFEAGKMYEQTLEAGLGLGGQLEARLGAARAHYLAGETSGVMQQCAEMFRQVSESEDFWSGKFLPDEVFMTIPVVITRLYRESADTASYRVYRRVSTDFYTRVEATWPGTPIARQAALGNVQICLVDEDWNGAADRIRAIVSTGVPNDEVQGLRLLLGEIYAFALNDPVAAREIFEDIERRGNGSAVAYAARYDRAALDLEQGNQADAMNAFRALEQDEQAPGEVVARAMFARASVLERQGVWDEALALLRRLQQVYPHEPPSIEAPILVTRHYTATGEHALAERTLERAREYYLSLIDRNGPFSGDRLRVQDALAKSYAAAGRPEEGAALLGAAPSSWDDASTAAGLMRSAEVYVTALGDTARAREMLEKCVERFPQTRYSRLAQRRLDELSGRPEASERASP
ncbi:MAG TPA: tetratricopeptide repeat protein [Candidatus Krumholzibacteria bacterium]|nr:tetratricopeptide repeat protein [Candidatus Krumholzibacteria bacterium]